MDRLAQFGIGTILDYSVEASQTEASFNENQSVISQTIRLAAQDRRIPFCVFKVTALGRFDLLEKKSAGANLTPAESAEWEKVYGRVEALCAEASQSRVRVFIDAEETWIQEAIDGLAYAMMRKFNRAEALIFNTLQMYRVDRLAHLERAYRTCEEEGFYAGFKVVRGAYLEKERERAASRGQASPLHATKVATDRAFDAAIDFILPKLGRLALCAGTHNEASTLRLAADMQKAGIARDDERVYFAQLLGMSDHLSFNLASENYRVAKYVPFGPVAAVFPYLVRRAQENTSVAGQTGRELALLSQERRRRSL